MGKSIGVVEASCHSTGAAVLLVLSKVLLVDLVLLLSSYRDAGVGRVITLNSFSVLFSTYPVFNDSEMM